MKYYTPLKTFTFLLIICSISFGQSNKKVSEEQSEIIIVKIGQKTISLNEFTRRAEYTIRPNYCRSDDMIAKKIILNSLIAEKMLAFEAGDNNELAKNKNFRNYIQGLKEQAMREWLFHKEGFEKVHLKDSEIQKAFSFAGRTYHINYVVINSDSLAQFINKKNYNKIQLFDTTQNQSQSGVNNVLERKVSWKSDELPVVQEALFTNNVISNQIIGPLPIDKHQYLVMKILGWTDSVVVSEKEKELRWNDVKKNLELMRAKQMYERFIGKVMDGKKLEFDPNAFYKVVDLLSPYFLRTPDVIQKMYSQAFQKKTEIPNMKEFGSEIDEILDRTFLRIDGNVWTVRDLGEELQKHPLVFRDPSVFKKKVTEKREIYEQFKLAIVDMIRDKYLSKIAYERGYQNVNLVKRNTQMWKDAYLAIYQRSKYLEDNLHKSSDSLDIDFIDKYMNPYIKKLQSKYSDQIEVNVQAFNELKLTRIDMFVTQQNVPFVAVVPLFPNLTTLNKLDYGKRLQ